MWHRETSKPWAAALCGGACAGKVRSKRATCLSAAGAVAKDTTLCRDPKDRRGCADQRHHHVGQRVWALRLPENYGVVARSWLACGQGSGPAHLASRRSKSAAETTATTEALAQ